MNGAQDLGGMQGFGPVIPEAEDERFHAEWERRAFALTIAMGATGTWTLDEARATRESLPPALYLSASYYRIWFEALERLLLAHGLVSADEVAGSVPAGPPTPVKRVLAGPDVTPALRRGGPVERPAEAPPAFAEGERVRVKLMNPAHHTRAPRYVRGRVGTVRKRHGVHVFPDTNAHGRGENPTWLYLVEFRAEDLWGPDTTAAAVSCDLWEPYLERA